MIRVLAARVVLNCGLGLVLSVAATVLAAPTLVQAPATTETRDAGGTAWVSELLARHGCWSHAAPDAAPEPRHAVVTRPGGTPRLVAAEVGFAIWLEGAPGTVHGFCP